MCIIHVQVIESKVGSVELNADFFWVPSILLRLRAEGGGCSSCP
jgi:hypothetical protein